MTFFTKKKKNPAYLGWIFLKCTVPIYNYVDATSYFRESQLKSMRTACTVSYAFTTMTKRIRQTISSHEQNVDTVELELENNTRSTQFNGVDIFLENRSIDDEILHTIFSSLFTNLLTNY